MKLLIMIYLLLKSAFNRKLAWFEIILAYAIQQVDPNCPDWLKMIANMEQETKLPEAFGDFWLDLGRTLGELIWGKE
jgi:hypothetical protein